MGKIIMAINHKPILLKMEENSNKKALAEKWSSTRRKLRNLNSSFLSWKNLWGIVILLKQVNIPLP